MHVDKCPTLNCMRESMAMLPIAMTFACALGPTFAITSKCIAYCGASFMWVQQFAYAPKFPNALSQQQRQRNHCNGNQKQDFEKLYKIYLTQFLALTFIKVIYVNLVILKYFKQQFKVSSLFKIILQKSQRKPYLEQLEILFRCLFLKWFLFPANQLKFGFPFWLFCQPQLALI